MGNSHRGTAGSDDKHMGGERRKFTGILLTALIIAFSLSPQFRNVYQFPPHMRVIAGETSLFQTGFPITVNITSPQRGFYLYNPLTNRQRKAVAMEAVETGKIQVQYRLFGAIPLRTIDVHVLPPLKVVPGGHSIGVVLHSHGVIVVGFSPIITGDGQMLTPAKEANITVGDTIMSVNGTPINSDVQVADLIDASGREGRPAQLLVKRGEEELSLRVSPVLCPETNRYRIGLFVRDSAAGVGTMTFYEPQSRIYGALGHIITDSDTNQPIDIDQGKIVAASVSGIQQGRRGHPGEKIGVFVEEDKVLGNIKNNTSFGIYGTLYVDLPNDEYPAPIPVASMTQVVEGPAEMLTVLDGQKIEKFRIEIQKVNWQDSPEGKSMVIKIIDSRLLAKTGGIVQGMSGSPIIQNGKLVGAVTHVFVHDPSRGYGVFIDWMLMESGLIPGFVHTSVRRMFTYADGFFVLTYWFIFPYEEGYVV